MSPQTLVRLSYCANIVYADDKLVKDKVGRHYATNQGYHT